MCWGIGLVLASLYALTRYWLYAFVQRPSPLLVRRRIKRGEAFGVHTSSPSTFEALTVQLVARYLPSPGKKKTTLTVSQKEPAIRNLKIPFLARFVAFLDSLDYLAPVLVNLVALLTYAGVFTWVYSGTRYFLSK